MRNGVDSTILRTTAELEALAPEWNALWKRDPQATPFQSPAWLAPWWRQFGGELLAVAIYAGERLIGLLPSYIYCDRRSETRQLMLLGVGTSDYLDGVWAPECTDEAIRAAFRRLQAEAGWDVLCFSQLRRGSRLLAACEEAAGADAVWFDGEGCSRMPAVTVAQLPQKIRRNAMYYRNRARREGALELPVADASNCLSFFEKLERLHGERWQSRGESGVLADERVRAWHREALPLLAREGLLRLCCLRLNEEPIGVLYSLIDPPGRRERTQYFYLTAFSIGHAELRPGTLLLALAIEQAAGEGVQTIDMLRGDESYKQMWHLERFPTRGFSIARAEIASDREAQAAA